MSDVYFVWTRSHWTVIFCLFVTADSWKNGVSMAKVAPVDPRCVRERPPPTIVLQDMEDSGEGVRWVHPEEQNQSLA